jgi:hypothetical protein
MPPSLVQSSAESSGSILDFLFLSNTAQSALIPDAWKATDLESNDTEKPQIIERCEDTSLVSDVSELSARLEATLLVPSKPNEVMEKLAAFLEPEEVEVLIASLQSLSPTGTASLEAIGSIE